MSMKKYFVLMLSTLFLTLANQAVAQDGAKKQASPKATATGKIGDKSVEITYFQPSVKGRKIWGELVPYGKVWRTGANNASVISFDKDVKVEGKALKAGKYALFTIPNEKEWTVIFSSKTDQWGSYSYSDKEDVLRVAVKPGKSPAFTEAMTFAVKDKKVHLMWENLAVAFNVD
jgi:hypothetical protein